MEESSLKLVAELVILLAIILVAAKIGAEAAQRFLRIPPVLGELAAGILIGPFALGGLRIGGIGPLFKVPHVLEVVNGAVHEVESSIPVAPELFFISQVAAVLLLFEAGLETNREQFIRYVRPAMAVAGGGVLLPFVLGVAATLMFGFASTESVAALLPALFVGAAMTATSVGITARVLADMRKLDTPEGVTIMAAAVVDDVLGVLILTVIIGINDTGEVSLGSLLAVAGKAVGFWLGLTIVGTLLSRYISSALEWFRGAGGVLALALALAFAAAGLAEMFGLAMIIGSYSMGLAMSSTNLKHRIEEQMQTVNHFMVPVFFVVVGMQVDVPAILSGALVFGLVLSLFAIISKVAGAGVPALFAGFNRRGSWRIAIGMLPRGEVALIVAGIGLASGVINQQVFGVTILMTVASTVVAPLVLASAFASPASGLRSDDQETAPACAEEEPPAAAAESADGN